VGNHVIIDHGNGEFSGLHGNGEFSGLHHLQPGSVRVKKGDRVNQGEEIGAFVFSGDTFLPHARLFDDGWHR
jgi:murein DD-endopeptidase MepM/ murein hydrolase activator NlpD